MSSNAFAPQGNTVCLAVTSTAHAAVQVPGAGPANMNYVVANSGTSLAFITALAPLAGGVASNPVAAIPVDGTPANGYEVLAGSKEVVTFPANAYFSAITAAGTTTTLYITPGEGV